MWIADGWKDYEVIDTSCGEKLERWGDYLLVRPDPQVIWDTPKVNKGWKHMNGHYHRSKKGGGEWEFFDLPEQWDIHYKGLTFNPQCGTSGEGVESFCIDRWCDSGGSGCGSFCYSCGCF